MSDTLTPAERTAIAAYTGPVTRCPTGACAIDVNANTCMAAQMAGWFKARKARSLARRKGGTDERA